MVICGGHFGVFWGEKCGKATKKKKMRDRRRYLLSVDILADVSNLLVDFLFMLLSLMELSAGFSKLRLFLLHQRDKRVREAAQCR